MEILEINDRTYKVAIADTEKERYQGLSPLTRLGKNKGMLFLFEEPKQITMSMRGMKFPLDFIFINSNWQVVDVKSGEVGQNEEIKCDYDCQMVLELNRGDAESGGIIKGVTVFPSEKLKTQFTGVKIYKHGGSFEVIGDKVYEVKEVDIKIDPKKLQILNNNGEVVGNIEPGARIFSREDTKEIIQKFKKGATLDLANLIVSVIDKQDKQAPDYVKK